MTSKLLILAVLLPALAAIATAMYEECRVGKSIPYNPLPECQQYVRRRCANDDAPAVKGRCCQQLRNLPKSCRCDALSIMVKGVITEEGRRVGRMEVPAGCSRERMANIASGIPNYGVCNLQTEIGYCIIWGGGMD